MTLDEAFMAQAIRLARRGLGTTWPNPSVGAVLVRPEQGNRIVGRGGTGKGGRPHAEVIALAEAGEAAKGATLYVSLEPCSHHGRTPPCADAVIAAGVSRVVVPMIDPNPSVSGQGLTRLRNAGILVEVGVLEQDAQQVALGHAIKVTRGRPAVTLKLAVGLDGLVPAGSGRPNFVTGEVARAHAHLLRARADAFLVGRGTVEADDPLLTCRLPGMEDRSPVRIVLDSALRMLPKARMLSDDGPPVWIVCGKSASAGAEDALSAGGAEIIRVETLDGRISLPAALAALAERGMTRILVEGGPNVAASFLERGVVDELALYRGAKPAGEGGLQPFGARGLDRLDECPHLTPAVTRQLGDDILEWRSTAQ